MYDFKFNGKWLSRFGGRCTNCPSIEIAQRIFKVVEIPGSSRASLIDYDYYSNVEFERQICLLSSLYGSTSEKLIESIINWISYSKGYCEFRDTEHKNMFTNAFISNFSQVIRELREYSTATIKFNREAFWYSDEGNKNILYTAEEAASGILLINPYNDVSMPLIVVEATAIAARPNFKIQINEHSCNVYDSVTETESKVKVTFDFDKKAVEFDSINERKYFDFNFDEFQGFRVGKNTIKISAAKDTLIINSVLIRPHWRRL